jgi:hypothetical protein
MYQMSAYFAPADNSIIATAIPKITDKFHSLEDVGWYGSGMSNADTTVDGVELIVSRSVCSLSSYHSFSPAPLWKVLQFFQHQMGLSHRHRNL